MIYRYKERHSVLTAADAFMPLRIEDYAMIGDCQTAALVG